MNNSTYIEVEDDVREDIGECLPSAPKKEKRRVEDVKPEPQEEKVTPDNFKYNIGDIIKVANPDMNLISPASPSMQYHEQRCAENAMYRRAYERLQEQRRRLNEMIGKNMVQLADAMHTDCMQRVNSITEDACCQPVKTHEEVLREQALMDSMSRNPTEWFANSTGFGLGFAVAAMMFADGEKMKRQMQETEDERPYLEEINRIDAQFDNEIICMSGFE